MTPSLQDLIARLEAATEGSRELDAEIAESLGLPPKNMNRPGRQPRWSGEQGAFWHPPQFTRSLDAALTLVPDGWEWLSASRSWTEDTGYSAVGTVGRVSPYGHYRGYAKTPAAALVIACLKARLAQEQSDG